MDALMSSAQLWVPWASVAFVLLGQAWLECLGIPDRSRAPHPAIGYFVAFGLLLVLPSIAALTGWLVHGGVAALGPITLLSEPRTFSDQLLVAAWLLSPVITYLAARFLFGSEDAPSYSIAAAAAISCLAIFSAPVVFAVALAIGGIGFATRSLGTAASSIGAAVAFVFIYAFAFAGGGPSIVLLVLSVLTGLMVALIASRGAGSRTPVFMIAAILPTLVIAWFDESIGVFDLASSVAAQASATYGGLLLFFALVPAVAAPLCVAPVYFLRVSWGRSIVLEPLAVLLAFLVSVGCTAALAVALPAAMTLISRLHQISSGTALIDTASLVKGFASAPLAARNWWLLAILLIPIVAAPFVVLAALTQQFNSLLGATGVLPSMSEAISRSSWADRFILIKLKRLLQLAPTLVVIAVLWCAAPLFGVLATPVAQSVNALFEQSQKAVQAVSRLSLN